MSSRAQNQSSGSGNKPSRIEFDTDVLVIGGGMAGFCAAMRILDKGLRVVMADKGTVGKSGFTPWANTFSVFDESLGDKESDWLAAIQSKGEYIVNLDYFRMQIEDTLARYNDQVKWGIINFKKEWDHHAQPAREYIVSQDRHANMRQILKERGVTLIERVMITDLLKDSGRVVGAIGFHVENNEVIVIKARATIMCTGAGAYKAPGYPVHGSTFDGDAMAYRVGATIAGKEFVDFHTTGDKYPAEVWKMWDNEFVNRIYETKGPSLKTPSIGISNIFQVHAEAPPLPSHPFNILKTGDKREYDVSIMPGPPEGNMVMGAATGLGVHKSEGIWPVDDKCFSGIPGLYAAGDALASMICGCSYPAIGTSLSGSAVQGYRAGEHAADYAAHADKASIPAAEITGLQDKIFEPLGKKNGFDPRWVSQVLLNTMAPYYILLVQDGKRLEGALHNVEFMRDSLAARMKAGNRHELRLVHEARNMILNAEMKLRACQMRTESRGNHYREDFPARNDKDWLAWILIHQGENGRMVLLKKPVPEAWQGDLKKPYEERYPRRFPGEAEYLKSGRKE